MRKHDSETSNVVDFANFKRSKEVEESFGRGRTPLHVSHLEGSKESPHLSPSRRSDAGDFGERMRRIKASLEKINQLMMDLKKTTRKPELVDMD